MKAAFWLARACRALDSASLLLTDGDPDRACSSAYYAMFYAARSALFEIGQPERALGKTHRGMINAFGQYLVLPGHIDPALGQAFAREHDRRLIADYEAEGIEPKIAQASIDSARNFVAGVEALMERNK